MTQTVKIRKIQLSAVKKMKQKAKAVMEEQVFVKTEHAHVRQKDISRAKMARVTVVIAQLNQQLITQRTVVNALIVVI